MSVDDRFWQKVTRTDACWLWHAAADKHGYGRFWDGRLVLAHRWSYERFVGPIPAGFVIDHLCRVPACVNPDHLEPKTQRGNIHAPGSLAIPAQRAKVTHCPRNHRLEPGNLRSRVGRRECLTCMRARNRVTHGLAADLSEGVRQVWAKWPELRAFGESA